MDFVKKTLPHSLGYLLVRTCKESSVTKTIVSSGVTLQFDRNAQFRSNVLPQGSRVRRVRSKETTISKREVERQYVAPKRRINYTRRHGVIFQKILFFIATAVSTANPVHFCCRVQHTSKLVVRENNIFLCLSGRNTKRKLRIQDQIEWYSAMTPFALIR